MHEFHSVNPCCKHYTQRNFLTIKKWMLIKCYVVTKIIFTKSSESGTSRVPAVVSKISCKCWQKNCQRIKCLPKSCWILLQWSWSQQWPGQRVVHPGKHCRSIIVASFLGWWIAALDLTHTLSMEVDKINL